MKLFAIYIGGKVKGANIELHDMRFVVATSILETFDEVRRQWWGGPKGLHIDCWAELDCADGYDVTLRPEPFEGSEKLYYVNVGGYDPAEFSEKHQNLFVVAPSLAEAKVRALGRVRHWTAPHRDDVYEAEQAFSLNRCASSRRLHVHLTPSPQARDVRFTCRYMPIGLPPKMGRPQKQS